MAIKVTLKDLIDDLDPQIRKLLANDFRDQLNRRPHILDIGYRALKLNNPGYSEKEFKAIYDSFISIVKAKVPKNRTFISIEDPGVRQNFAGSTPYLVYIDGGPGVQLLAAKSFDAIQRFISDITKDTKLQSTVFGQRAIEEPVKDAKGRVVDTKTKYVTNVEIGHIATQGEGGEFLTSPLAEKISAILEFAAIQGMTNVEKYAEEALNKVYAVQADIDYTFKNTTPEVFEGIERVFGQTAVVVTLHTFNVNQKFSEQEKAIFTELQRKIALLASKPLVAKYMQNMISSNSMMEDIQEGIINTIKTGKSKLPKHTKKSAKTPKQSISKPNKLPANTAISIKISQAQNTPRQINLTSLQTLLNLQLQETIAQNMGDGGRKDILNYRTGRFASSAEVKKLSVSRDGMITAFYNYMRNPYATFSVGGAQEYPRSRDPKLLISKSIREIAAKVVTNRLRAVLV